MASSAIFEEALKAYKSLYPKSSIPKEIPEERLLQILHNSKGREITFHKKGDDFEAFYSDQNIEESILKPEWKKLLGCGG